MSENAISGLYTIYPNGQQLNDEPGAWVFGNFASPIETAALRKAAAEKLQPAQVSGNRCGFISPARSGSNCWIPHGQNRVILNLAERISALVNIPLQHAESFQVVHYGPTQEYRAHLDAWEHGTERGDRCMQKGGQRLITCLVYLNEVSGGGATGFPELGIKVDPQPGRMVIFHNCHAGTVTRHPHSMHGGLPVTAGEKWAANLWFRENPLR